MSLALYLARVRSNEVLARSIQVAQLLGEDLTQIGPRECNLIHFPANAFELQVLEAGDEMPISSKH